MSRPISLILLIIFSTSSLFSQKNVGNTYKANAVMDSTYGIIMYNSLMTISGIDSVRYDAMKLPLQGLVIDMYDNGQMLHKGTYDKGRLVSFNNYYADGKKERTFITLSTSMCNLKVFYESGKVKSEVDYRDGNARKWSDYYENGQLEFYEEYSGDNAYILSRKAFKENGKPDYDLKLVNSKIRKYIQKEYYTDGKLHQEGELLYFADVADLRKDGNWETYSEHENLVLIEHFSNGVVTEKQDSIALLSSAAYIKQSKAVKKKQEEKLAKEEKKKAEQDLADKKKSDEILAKMEKEENASTSTTKMEEPKKEEENKSEVTNQKSEETNKKGPNNKTNASKTPTGVPSQFKFADKDKNGKITALEVSQAISAFFDDESGKLKPEDISKLIDYFFDQE